MGIPFRSEQSAQDASFRFDLHHRKQAQRWGCMYHAIYALTGDEALLEQVDDISLPRWFCAIHQQGLIASPLYAHHENIAGEREWDLVSMLLMCTGTHRLLMCIDSLTRPGSRHQIAVVADFDQMKAVVSDSTADGIQVMDWEAFRAGPYARAYEVLWIGEAHLHDYAFDHRSNYPITDEA